MLPFWLESINLLKQNLYNTKVKQFYNTKPTSNSDNLKMSQIILVAISFAFRQEREYVNDIHFVLHLCHY